MNPDWTRWIHASLCTYVKAQLEALQVVVHFENQDRADIAKLKDAAEFRWNGPEAREYSRGWWELEVHLNFVAISTTNRKDTYAHKVLVGKIQSILRNSISIFKFGTGVNDDQSLFGCLQLRINGRDSIMTNYFGRIVDPTEIEESTVEATYFMCGRFT